MSYTYGIIDAQWVLTRNYHAVKSNFDKLPENGHSIIVSSVLQSIIKFQEELECKKMILLFDTYPYYKHELLSGDYKSSRSYTTEEMVEECEDEEEKERLAIDAHNLLKRGQAKWLLKSMQSMGLPSFFKKGFEADDLAYLASGKVTELNTNAILISVDSDWNYFVNDNVDWYSPKRGITTYKDTLDEIPLPKGLSLFEYKKLYDSFYGSHNDFYQTVTDEMYELSFIDFYNKYINEKPEKLFKDYELFKNQLNALDIDNYPDIQKAYSMMYYLDKTGSIPTKGLYEEWRVKNMVTVEDWKYWKLINKFDKSLFYD